MAVTVNQLKAILDKVVSQGGGEREVCHFTVLPNGLESRSLCAVSFAQDPSGELVLMISSDENFGRFLAKTAARQKAPMKNFNGNPIKRPGRG